MSIGIGLGPSGGGGDSFKEVVFASTVTPVCDFGDQRMTADGNLESTFQLNKPVDTTPCNFLLVVEIINSTVDLTLGPDVVIQNGAWDNAVGAVNAMAIFWDGVTMRVMVVAAAASFSNPVVGGPRVEAVRMPPDRRLRRTTTPVGVSDTKLGLMSFWYKGNRRALASIPTTLLEVVGPVETSRLAYSDDTGISNGDITFWPREPDGTTMVLAQELPWPDGPHEGDGWAHFLISWDTTSGSERLQIAFNGVLITLDTSTIVTDALADWTTADWTIGASADFAVKPFFSIAEFYLNTDETLDLATAANIEKFLTPDNFPEDLGSDGSTPTGTAPLIYLNGDAANFHVNAGSGGDFFGDGAGSFTDDGSSPSDTGVGGGVCL